MAKKNPERAREVHEQLAAAGLGDCVSPTELEIAFGRATDLDLAIAHRLATIATPESAEVLLRIDRSAAKDVRKEIKRSLYRLEQRGVEIPRPAAEPRTASTTSGVEGYVSAFDGRGDRLVWLVKPRPGNVVHLFAVVNDPIGLREIALNRLTRRALREIQAELQSKHDIRLVAVDWRHADLLLWRALEWARQGGRSVDGDYPSLRSQLTSEAVLRDMSSPIAGFADSLPVEDVHLVDSAELLIEPELRTWLMDDDLAQQAVQQLAEVRDSPLVLNDAQLLERFDAVNERFIDRAFGGELRLSWERRLREMAYYFDQTSRPVRALQAAAVALALQRGDVLSQIPFCSIYVRRTVGLYFDETEKKEEQSRESSLVITPDQMRRTPRRG